MIGKRREGPPEVRFWPKVDTAAGLEGCWEWRAARNAKGYGIFCDRPQHSMLAHDFAFQMLVGPIPDGLELDHTCRNRGCVNPRHLEAVTHLENVRRGDSGKYLRARTHCPHGHAYAGTNLIIRPGGARHCRTCRNAAARLYKIKGGDAYRAKRAEAERKRRRLARYPESVSGAA